MDFLKQSTAATVKLGPFVDDVDGKTAETGLTIAQADIRLSKNGGAFAQTNNATGATHDENGYYGVPLDTTDTGTLGRLRVAVSDAGALPVWMDFMVLPANVYDALVGGSDKLQVDTVEVGGTAQTAADLAALITAVDDYLDTEIGDIQSRLPAALTGDGLMKSDALRVGGTLQTAADLAALLNAIDDYLDTEIAELLVRIPANLTAPTGAPSATPTVREALAWLLTQARNKQTEDGTTQTLYADDGTTPIATSSTSDDGNTFTTGKWT